MRRLRIVVWALAAVALVGAGFLLLRKPAGEQPAPAVARVSLGGPFTLTDASGRAFASSQLVGSPYAIFFGFTHCPDVCPTTLARLVKLRGQLGDAGKDLAIVFVTVDPQRDRPEVLREYVSLFREPIVGLTGTPTQIDRVKRQFGIYSQKVPDEAGGYTVDHTAAALLFDRQGKFVATISPQEADPVALQKLERIIG